MISPCLPASTPLHACGVDDGTGHRSQSCSRSGSLRPNATGSVLESSEGLSVKVIENALVLAATRRLIRPFDAPPLGTIRSLAYFLPVIEEVLEMRVRPDYFEYLRHKLTRIAPVR